MKEKLNAAEMFYGILNQRGIAMIVEQILMIIGVKVTGLEMSIMAVIETLCIFWLPTIIFVMVWELVLRPEVVKHLPEFAGRPAAFTGGLSERWHQFCGLPLRQCAILIGMAIECGLTVLSTVLVVLLDVLQVFPPAFILLRCSIECLICRELLRFTYPATLREAGRSPE